MKHRTSTMSLRTLLYFIIYVDRSLQCFSCNTGFSSLELLASHPPCCSTSFDLAKVKTEIEDPQQNVRTSMSASSQAGPPVKDTGSAVNIGHVKTEVKSEIPEVPETGYSDATAVNTVVKESALLNLQNKRVVSQYRGRGGRARGSRGGRGGLRGALNSHKTLPATKDSMLQSMSFKSSSLINYLIPGLQTGTAHSKLTNILPKTANNVNGNGLNKTDVVNFLRSLEVTNTTNTVSAANIVIPNTFMVNNLSCNGSSLTGANVNCLPFSSFILSNNIVTNTQQDTVFLGGSAPLLNPLPSTNTLQAPSLVPGFQTINVSQPLTNFPNLNLAPNQNTALGIQQNIAQVFNSATQSGAMFTGNMNQTVSSVVASTVSSSQQMSYKVPVLIGNQIVIVDMPAQYPTGVSLANTPATVSLPSFGQSLGLFTSAVTPTADTKQATAACIVSTTLPCNSLSANSVHPQPDVAATSLSMIPHLQSHPGTANTMGAQETCTKTLKSPPPLILAGSTVSQRQSQDGTKLLSARNDTLCSQNTTFTAEASAKTKLQTVQHVKSKRMETPSNLGSTGVNLFSQLQPKDENNSTNNNKELHCERNVTDTQKNTQNSELSVGSATNLTSGTMSNKPNFTPAIVKQYSLNNKELSCTTSKAGEISKTSQQHVRSLRMETPDTIERKMFPSGRQDNKQSLGMKTPVVSDNAGTEKQQKTVKEMLQSKKPNSAENMAKPSKSQHAGNKLRLSGPGPKSKLHFRRLQFPMLPEKTKESVDKTLQPSSKLVGISTELLPDQTVNNGQGTSSVDDSDKSQSNDDVICKISEVKSIADIHSDPQLVLLKNKDLNQHCNDLNSAQGMVFVGPLTKEQLDLIIQNPSELGKYVSVPNGIVLSSKAIAVPAVSSAATAPVMVKSVAVPKKIAPASAVHSYIPFGYPESQFVKIHPKPTCLSASTATTNTTSSTVTSSPQATLPVLSTSFSSSSSTAPQTSVNSSTTACDKDIGGKKRMVKEEKSDVKCSPCSSEMYEDENEASSHKHEYQLECNTAKDSQNSSIIKLSFNGDLNLLKDALRKTTVELETLDSKTLINAAGHPSRDDDSSDQEMSDISEDDYKPKPRKRRWHDSEELNIVLTRNETGILEYMHKRWVPLEVVGDLAIRGRLLGGEVVESGDPESRRIRRSVRISAKPRLDYADLERLPFQDLDHDLEESDFELYTTAVRPHSQSPSPPQLCTTAVMPHSQSPSQLCTTAVRPHSQSPSQLCTTAVRPHSQSPSQLCTTAVRPHSQSPSQLCTTAVRPHSQSPSPPQLYTTAVRPHSPSPSQLYTTAVRPHSPSPSQLYTTAVRPHSPSPSQLYTTAVRPHSQSPSQLCTTAVRPHSQSPSQLCTTAVRPLSQSPSQLCTTAVRPHSQSPSPTQLCTTAVRPQSPSPPQLCTTAVRPQSPSPPQLYTTAVRPQSPSPPQLCTTAVRPQSPSPSPPQLSPILDQVHNQDMFVDIPPSEKELDTGAQNNDIAAQNNDTATQNNDTSAQNNDTAAQNNDTAAQNNDTSAQNNETAVQRNDTTAQNNDTTAHNNDTAERDTDTAAQNSDTAAQNTDGTIHPVLESPAMKDSDDSDSLSQVNGCEDCYYSSESESDMFDSCDKSLSDAGKKKMLWKRHSEMTLFLVKHAGKFHSDDEKGEHYCNICCGYKTNGIFRLSHHLKKHLDGALRCSQCDFEARHKLNLEEHRKTRHAL